MTDKDTKPTSKELSNEELDSVQGGAKTFAAKSTDKDTEYKFKLTNAHVTSFNTNGTSD